MLDRIDLHLLDGKTIVQMSTIAPDESINLGEQLSAYGAEYVEAPVLGSIPQIKEKSLIVLFGGEQKQLTPLNEIFESFSNKIEHIGKVGEASAMKLALNQLIVGLTTIFSMSLGFVRESGLNVEKFISIVGESALNAPTFSKKLVNYQSRKYDNPNFPLKHLLKDLNLIHDAFSKKNINVDALTGIQKILNEGIENGLGELDYSALYEVVHKKESAK
jgi:3-hydroxyisobutyrate dehydrogenase